MGQKRTDRTMQQPKENARLSKERFRIIWEKSFDGMRLIDESGRIVMVNDAYCRQVDKPREELEGCLLDEVYAQPAGRRILQVTVERIQKQSIHPHFERLVTLWNGNKVWFELSNSFIDLDTGQHFLLSIFRDITDRKRAEEELRNNQDYLQSIFRAAPAGIGVVVNRVIVRANQQLCGMTGYSESELVNQSARMLYPGDEGYEYVGREKYRQIQEQGTGTVETRWRCKNGKIIDVLLSSTPIDWNDHSKGITFTALDITERKQYENALHESEKRVREILDCSQDVIYRQKYADGRFDYISPAVTRMFGYAPEEIQQMSPESIQALFHPDDLQKLMPFRFELEQADRSGRKLSEREFRLMNRSGEHRWIHGQYELIRTADGAPECIVGTLHDITERKRAEDALCASEERFRGILQNVATVAVQGYTLDGTVRYWNRASESFYGYTAAEALGRNLLDLIIPPAMRDEVRGAIRRMAETGEPIPSAELALMRKDGSLIPVYSSHALVRVPGQELEFFCIDVDLSARQRAEAALRSSEALYHDLVETSQDLIWQCDAQGRYTYLNPAWEQVFGYRLDEMLGRSFADFQSPEQAQRDLELFGRLLLTEGLAKGYETIHLRKDGTELHLVFNAKVLFDANNQVSGTRGTAYDITERKRGEAELLRTRALLDAAFDQSPVPMVLTTYPDMILRYVNNSAADFLCINADECRLKNLLDIPITWKELKPDGSEWELEDQMTALPLPRALRGLETKNMEMQIRVADGSVKWELASGAPVRDQEGNLIAGLLIMQDITQRKHAEAERERLQAQLNQAQKMESVGRLAGGVAHDFNNMLGAILGYSELALKCSDPSLLPNYLQKIQKAAERSADLTRQLLAFARKQTVAPKVLNLNATVEPMLDMIRRLIGEDIELVWQPGADLGSVFMDPSQVDQILANLCVNARDAIAGTGKITIATGDTVLDQEFCNTHAGFVPGEYVLLSVGDDGSGMDAETLTHLFEPFFTTKHLGKGTGLGLATVYGAVSQNNGFIDVISKLGEGTTFAVYLPRHAGKTLQDEPDDSTDHVNKGRETILLVEDESAILDISVEMLEASGYQILAAKTPGEAIQKAREHPGRIHLLITDVIMPEMNGRELAKNILTLYPNLRCLFISGYTADIIAHHGVLEPGVHFLQKPFTTNGLAKKVREALEGE